MPGAVPSTQPGPGDAVCGGAPRGTPGVRRSTPRRWVHGVMFRNWLTKGLSPLFPECLLNNWNESY